MSKKAKKIIIIAIFGILLVFTLMSINNNQEYMDVYQDPIRVNGVISDIDSYSDDDGTRYRSYVTYTVNGILYKNIRYESDSKLSDLDEIGDTVYLEINPNDHSQLLKNIKQNIHTKTLRNFQGLFLF